MNRAMRRQGRRSCAHEGATNIDTATRGTATKTTPGAARRIMRNTTPPGTHQRNATGLVGAPEAPRIASGVATSRNSQRPASTHASAR